MRLLRRKSPGEPEPTHKRVMLDRVVKVYFSGTFSGGMESGPDRVIVGGYQLTEADIDRGWVDVDALALRDQGNSG